MNVLPFVSAFILIFALCSYAFVHNVTSAIEERVHYSAFQRISRAYDSVCINERFKQFKAVKKNQSPKSKQTKSLSDTPYKSPRERMNKLPEMKCNLRALLDPTHSKTLLPLAQNMVRRLYFLTPFYYPDLEKEILTQIVEALKQHPDCASFEELSSHLPPEKMPLYYKLIKGTGIYKVSTTTGYPPLGDFFTIRKGKGAPIHFCFCSAEILEEAVGSRLARLIKEEEKKKWEDDHKHRPLSKAEFERIASAEQKNPADFDTLFSFSTSKHGASYQIIHDEEAKVRIRFQK